MNLFEGKEAKNEKGGQGLGNEKEERNRENKAPCRAEKSWH